MSGDTQVCWLLCKDEFGNDKRFEVPKEVFEYVLMLESYVKNPERSSIKKIYKNKFNCDYECNVERRLKRVTVFSWRCGYEAGFDDCESGNAFVGDAKLLTIWRRIKGGFEKW